MRILIRTFNDFGNTSTFSINCEPQDTVSDLQEQIFKRLEIEPSCQILKVERCGFQVRMCGDWSLEFFEITDTSILTLEKIVPEKIMQTMAAGSEKTEPENRASLPRFIQRLGMRPMARQHSSQEFDPASIDHSERQHRTEKIEKLLKAAKEGNLEHFKEALEEADVPVDEAGVGGWNSLHFASYCGSAEIVRELLRRKSDPNTESSDLWTPLQLACSQGHEDVVGWLLKGPEIDIDHINDKRGTALHCAAARSHTNIIHLLLDHKVNCSIRNSSRLYPFELAVKPEIVELLRKNTDICQKSDSSTRRVKRPEKRMGFLFHVGSLFFNENWRYFVLEPERGVLIRYKSEHDYPNKPREVLPLSTILQCRRVKHGWFKKDKRFYFEIVFDHRHIMSSKNESEANEWVKAFNEAIQYNQYVEAQKRRKLTKVKSMFDRSAAAISEVPTAAAQNNRSSIASVTEKSEEGTRADRESEVESSFAKMPDIKTREEQPPAEVVNFDSFEILKSLGSGAFGTVFLVKKKNDGKIYAMKVLKKHYLNSMGQLSYAVSECFILKTLNCPFIVKLHYAFQTPYNLYMVIDYCSGGDLSIQLQMRLKFEENLTKIYIAEILLAIETLHARDIIYRDMKPENILIDEEGHLKLADFGLAKEGVQDHQVAESFCGSPVYLSPEMVARRGAGKAADLYQVGAMMYEFLVGRPPFYHDDVGKLLKDIKKGKLKFPSYVSKPAKTLIKKLMNRNPDERITIQEIRRDPWFANLDWTALKKKDIAPPVVLRQHQGSVFGRRPSWTDENYTDVVIKQDRMMGLLVPEFDYRQTTETSS